MGELKPIASLSGILLARKGLARPAMRRPSMFNGNMSASIAQDDLGWNDMGFDVDPDPSTPMDYDHNFHGANMLAGVVPEVKHQQDRLEQAMEANSEPEAGFDSFMMEPALANDALTIVTVTPEPVTRPISRFGKTDAPRSRARSKSGSKDKAAFTLRLDSERHLKLRLACAVQHESAQQLVTAALDALIESMPEIGHLASQIPDKRH
ncbi:hypothetical protein [Sphingorhabdus sp.]|jgi:hypothetical protein|uniref:hypothetical protein n=1 Tax=Sphingorhabdus sp. TaxID=1902408 RepID=UPI0037C7D47D